MKLGDKVRFLNDVGGGTITGFPDKQTVLVCDEDGFEIPTLRKDVVVIETDDYNLARKVKTSKKRATEETEERPATSVKQALAVTDEEEEEEEVDLADREMSYRPMAQERRGADVLNLSLAFVPANVKTLSETAFEAYLVNDSNYYIHYTLFAIEGQTATLRYEGELMPNTKFFLEEFRHEALQEWENLVLHTIAYKRGKAFLPKSPLQVRVHVDGTKFYKLHSFRESAFFTVPAYVMDLVKDDLPVKGIQVDADELREALMPHNEAEENNPLQSGAGRRAARNQQKKDKNALVEVDLHASELLDTFSGLESRDILEYQLKVFRDTMNEHLKHKGRRIVFIHGKGDGVLRQAILRELRVHYPQCRYQDASFREYGYGATMVTI